MITKPVVAGLLAVGCLGAAAGGAYIAVRQNAVDGVAAQAIPASFSMSSPSASMPVAETEAVVTATAAPSAPDAPIETRDSKPEGEIAAEPPPT